MVPVHSTEGPVHRCSLDLRQDRVLDRIPASLLPPVPEEETVEEVVREDPVAEDQDKAVTSFTDLPATTRHLYRPVRRHPAKEGPITFRQDLVTETTTKAPEVRILTDRPVPVLHHLSALHSRVLAAVAEVQAVLQVLIRLKDIQEAFRADPVLRSDIQDPVDPDLNIRSSDIQVHTAPCLESWDRDQDRWAVLVDHTVRPIWAA